MAIRPAQRAGIDSEIFRRSQFFQDLAAIGHPANAVMQRISDPHAALRIDRTAIRAEILLHEIVDRCPGRGRAELGEQAPVRQHAIVPNRKGRHAVAECFGHHQRLAVRRHNHSVGEQEIVCHFRH